MTTMRITRPNRPAGMLGDFVNIGDVIYQGWVA
jgi:hypothetical protein